MLHVTDTEFPVTATLFVRDCPFDHVYAVTTSDAVAAYMRGDTVVVPNLNMARLVLLRSGMSVEEADKRVVFTQKRLLSAGLSGA